MLRNSRAASTSKIAKSRSKKQANSDSPKVLGGQSKNSVKSGDVSKTSSDKISSKKLLKSDTLAPSTFTIDKDKNANRRSKPKTLKKTSSAKSDDLGLSKRTLPHASSNVIVPDNTAAHFGNFYSTKGDKRKFDFAPTETKPKSQFTRQTLHTLEQTAGTSEYAQKLSALLEETLEPPNFRINQPPAESSIPSGKDGPAGYPRWYKEPHKMPITVMEEYLNLMEEFANMDYDTARKRTLELFGEKSDAESESEKSVGESSASDEINSDPAHSNASLKEEYSRLSDSSSSLFSENAESACTSASSADVSEEERKDNFETANAYLSSLSAPLFQNDQPSATDKVVSV